MEAEMKTNYWVNIIFLLVMAYGAYMVLSGKYQRFGTPEWQYYLALASPWGLLWASAKAWHRCYAWRRMLAERYRPPVLSRGQSRPEKSAHMDRPNILEHVCFALFVLGSAAVLTLLGVANVAWWIGSSLGCWFTLRLAIRKVS